MRVGFWGVSFLVVLGLAAPAWAQPMIPGGGLQRPTVSPYINLVRGNSGIGNAAVNYYGIVRPEQQFRQQATQFQQQLAATNQNISALGSANDTQQPLVTGKGGTFQFYSHYFNSFGGTGAVGGSNIAARPMVGPASFGGNTGRNVGSGFTIGNAPNAARGGRR